MLHQGDHFENRPDWVRFEKMFGGDKNNSLAFCDVSNLQVGTIIIAFAPHAIFDRIISDSKTEALGSPHLSSGRCKLYNNKCNWILFE